MRALAALTRRSAISFEVPITLVGFTALSEEVSNSRSTPVLTAASMMFWVPRMLA